jgi:FtsP/CotA-like multicopper oxidase with cupredoxin domain
MVRIIKLLFMGALLSLAAPALAMADATCPRPIPGSDVNPPPDLYSNGGRLQVKLNYWTGLDAAGRTLYCFKTDDNVESPTLHVKPGDLIDIQLTNQIPDPHGPSEFVSRPDAACGSATMTLTSTNMHFHGLNVSPGCHHDETIHTMINSGQTFHYKIHIPADEPPGMYWYHPHVHGTSSINVQGGSTGAIEVEGIENIQPAVAGLPQRFLIVRDQPLLNPPGAKDEGPQPNWDVSLNYVSLPFPEYPKAIIRATHGTNEFWRVVNAGANTILDLEVIYDGKTQPLQVVGFDGVPTGSQDGKHQGTIVTLKHIPLPPAGRVEFILAMPSKHVAQAYFQTRAIKGGPASDTNPARPLAQIIATDAPVHLSRVPERSGPPWKQRFDNLANARVNTTRTLYFSEVPGTSKPRKLGHPPTEPVNFYITVVGQTPKLFDPNNPPAITTNRGAVEDWIIQNRTFEVHEFHIHQIHFLLLEVNGKPVPKDQQQFYDTYQVGFWDGIHKYPYIKVRMDFRGAVVGDFVYHCHILDHEDGGMMATIRVLPKDSRKKSGTASLAGGGKHDA